MNLLLAVPLAIRLSVLALVGAGLGALVNWIVDRIRWEPTFDSPWSRPPTDTPLRGPLHYLPIWGWWSRRHERKRDRPNFWLRSAAIECGLAAAVPALYWYEVVNLALVPDWRGPAAGVAGALHVQFASHVVLLFLMTIASLVDLDERVIPDAITVPGTVLGLLLAALVPASLLPEVVAGQVQIVTLASPHPWPAALEGRPQAASLGLALGCLWLWCAGLMPRVWRPRRGWRVGVGLFLGRLRDRATLYCALLGIAASAGIFGVWWRGGIHWRALLTALVGMAITGGFTWMVRVVAGGSIGREALGFGDVTLMALIGAFLGWQAGLMVFFLAPFLGLVSGLLQWVVHREPEIPYGPFLCLAALSIVLGWPEAWEIGRQIFILGWTIPVALFSAVVLMGMILTTWHWILGR